MPSKTFVLVHGSWHGGWCWRRVADRLQAGGHKAFTPTLTGLGERVHLLTRDTDLDTHVTDIVNLIDFEGLADIVLVGHSYAGCVVSGVAEQRLASIASIVLLDAYLPDDGQRMLDLTTEAQREVALRARATGDLTRPIVPAAAFGVNEGDCAWVDSKLTPQPLGTSFTVNRLTGARDKVAKKTYIRAAGYAQPAFDQWLAQCAADRTWRTHTMECGHDVMIDQPDELTELLLAAA